MSGKDNYNVSVYNATFAAIFANEISIEGLKDRFPILGLDYKVCAHYRHKAFSHQLHQSVYNAIRIYAN